jgi:xanthine dehydrogenase small subunit
MDGPRVERCRIAFGGVDKVPRTAARSEAFLAGKKLDAETIRRAGEVAAGEFTPISDVRGSALFRRMLIRNQVIWHLQRVPGRQSRRKQAGDDGI